MEIISRHCINPEIQIHQSRDSDYFTEKIVDYNEFCDFINYWKIILVEKYQAKPGNTICIIYGPNLYYYALIFAAAELGLLLVVDWPHVYSEQDLKSYKVTMFGRIDFIVTSRVTRDPSYLHYNHFEIQRDEMFGKHIIFNEEFDEYIIKDPNLYSDLSSSVWATPDTPLVYSFTSGTTGLPKKVITTHKKIFSMASRIGKYLFDKNSSVLHTATIHHGFAFCLHLIPAFMLGKEQHSFVSVTDTKKFSEFILTHKINQLFLYRATLLLPYLQSTPMVNHRVRISTLYQITKEMALLIKEKNIASIQSIFGDTSIGVGFFIKYVDQNTDSSNYQVNNMGKPLDDFYKLELRNSNLYIACPTLNEDWKTSNDTFKIINDDWYFFGRSNEYRINGEWVKLVELENQVNTLFGIGNATVVIDPDLQKIYLAIWSENSAAEEQLNNYLKTTYSSLTISYILRNVKFDEFFNSRKIDSSKIREYCRRIILKEKYESCSME